MIASEIHIDSTAMTLSKVFLHYEIIDQKERKTKVIYGFIVEGRNGRIRVVPRSFEDRIIEIVLSNDTHVRKKLNDDGSAWILVEDIKDVMEIEQNKFA